MQEAGTAKTHAFGVYGGRLVFLLAHLGKQSEPKSGLDCREKRDGAITFMRFKDNMGGGGEIPLGGSLAKRCFLFWGFFVPLCFSTLFFTILPAHSIEPCVVEFFQHNLYPYLKLRCRGEAGKQRPRCH